jgi:hypothetical protein
MNGSIQNFYKCVAKHPQFVPEGKIFIGYTECYNELANDICISSLKLIRNYGCLIVR